MKKVAVFLTTLSILFAGVPTVAKADHSFTEEVSYNYKRSVSHTAPSCGGQQQSCGQSQCGFEVRCCRVFPCDGPIRRVGRFFAHYRPVRRAVAGAAIGVGIVAVGAARIAAAPFVAAGRLLFGRRCCL